MVASLLIALPAVTGPASPVAAPPYTLRALAVGSLYRRKVLSLRRRGGPTESDLLAGPCRPTSLARPGSGGNRGTSRDLGGSRLGQPLRWAARCVDRRRRPLRKRALVELSRRSRPALGCMLDLAHEHCPGVTPMGPSLRGVEPKATARWSCITQAYLTARTGPGFVRGEPAAALGPRQARFSSASGSCSRSRSRSPAPSAIPSAFPTVCPDRP